MEGVMNFLARAIRVIKGPSSLVKISNAINTTPIRHFRKSFLRLVHRRSYQRRQKMLKLLGASDSLLTHIQELRNSGFTLVTEKLNQDLCNELLQASNKTLQEERVSLRAHPQGKDLWQRLLDNTIARGELTNENIFVRFALQKNILRIVSSYYGEIPYVSYVFLSLSHRREKESLAYSQLWHKDYDDTKTIKFFVYLNDVTSEHGPFTYLPKNCSRRVKERFFPIHQTDEIFKSVPPEDVRQVVGPQFTSFLVDTGHCYHMGSRIKGDEKRLAFTVAYTTSPPIYRNSINRILLKDSISDLHRMVLRP